MVAALVEQQQAFLTNMQTLTETLVQGGGSVKSRERRAPRQADADAMDVDDPDGEDADDEDEFLPVKVPRKKPFKLTSLPVRRSYDENALKVGVTHRYVDPSHVNPMSRPPSGR